MYAVLLVAVIPRKVEMHQVTTIKSHANYAEKGNKENQFNEAYIMFKGPLNVEDNDFALNAERFIIRDNEISFLLSGYDEDGGFLIEGVGVKTEHGFYMAPRIPVKYNQFAGEYKASIKISSINIDNNSCHISGCWIQDGDIWNFSGTLEMHNA